MSISYTLHDINFAWDKRKASVNFRKHGVSFEIACEAFFDPFLRVVDAGVVEDEPREAIIGITVNWHLLYVVYVLAEDIVRLISARTATRAERNLYENQ
jgi:hypothetical protein